MAEKKLSDEEILRMVEEFYSTPEEKRNFINQGWNKKVFEIPNSQYVLKEIAESNPEYNKSMAIEDYITHKQLSEYAPVEQPLLVTRGINKNPVLLQRKLDTSNIELNQKVANKINEKLKKLGIDITSADIHEGNIGSINGVAKVFDSNPFVYGSINKTKPLQKAREEAIEKIGKETASKVFRQVPLIGPAIGAGLAAMSGEANAASAMPILGEADSLGPQQGSEDYEIENPQRNPAARRAALEKLSR